MTTIALFHSALGLRPGMLGFAAHLRAAGHAVHQIDSFGSEIFDDLDQGTAKRDALGIPELIRRAQQGVEGLPTGTIYAGFSSGCGAADFLALADVVRGAGADASSLHELMNGGGSHGPAASLALTSWTSSCPRRPPKPRPSGRTSSRQAQAVAWW